jgi:hypothetical protein
MSVSNLATFLSEAGDRQGALAAAQEAVALYRALARENPQAFTPNLAASVSNLATFLSEAGDRQGALAAAQEAVALYRALARENPQAFTPNLAASVSNLAGRLSEAGDRQGALAAAQEAVALYRALARENPQAFTPNLAMSLGAYGQALLNGGTAADARLAMAAFLDGAQAIKPFMDAMPQAFGGLFQKLVREYLRAAQAAGAEEAEIIATLDALGVELGDGGGGQPQEIALFQAWAQAHNEGRGADAMAAYARLIAALDAQPANAALDPIRDAVDGARAQLGGDWPYGDGPRRG